MTFNIVITLLFFTQKHLLLAYFCKKTLNDVISLHEFPPR